MNMTIEKLLEYCPWAEVLARKFFLQNTEKKSAIKRTMNTTQCGQTDKISLDMLSSEIRNIGVQSGDLLIVHSSMDGLKNVNASPMQIISCLKEIIGLDGTLVFPVFPCDMKRDFDGDEIYDLSKTKIWTGLLPYVFLRYSGTIRSRFPVNTLAANGKMAKDMMRNEMNTDLAHGNNSTWKYCVDHHAKVLYLGLRVRQADTLLHVVEDTMEADWPIKHWYKQRKYHIEDNGIYIADISARVRDGAWHQYFASFYSGRMLAKRKLIIEKNVFQTHIAIVPDAQRLVTALIQDAKQGKTFYYIPKKDKIRAEG